MMKKIKTALVSVYKKKGLADIVIELNRLGVKIYSTGGTQSFIESLGIRATPVEELTGYPSILGGRVKTLHPKVFGGILAIRDDVSHQSQLKEYDIPEIDLVIVDLYPFEETLKAGASHDELIEKIDIGGVTLIRATAKNYYDTVVIASDSLYPIFLELLKEQNGETNLEQRSVYAREAFHYTSAYDSEILDYFEHALQHTTFNCYKIDDI